MRKKRFRFFTFCLMTMVMGFTNLTTSLNAAPFKVIESVTEADPMPEFPGGQEAFEKYINDHITFPTDEIKMRDYKNLQIKLYTIIMSDGTVGPTNIVMAGNHPNFNSNEVKEILKEVPKFIPGKVNGVPVNVSMCIPVTINPPGVE